ncbi:MAG: hypothetical protein KA053_12175 [Lentimicrobiaceae bacterium]|nr:hypothetical protein [Lentimicrobiaceae bacterium]
MAELIYHPDPTSEEIAARLKQIPTCPGTCIFIDIINSTALKYESPLWEWGVKLNNTFNFISFLNDFPDHFVKGIGDELMLYIPDDQLFNKQGYQNYLGLLQEIYSTIDNIKNFPVPGLFLQCKVVIHYCTSVYNITFFKGYNDYYGQDIDLTARLMTKGKGNRIVMSEVFFQRVSRDIERNGEACQKECLDKISDKYIEDFKGIPQAVALRILDV